ncbi:NADPH-dependent FMN reductase SsuE family [Thermosynechococcus sp. NK55a]|jgi:NAD(P)H-dependent FMN reductase|uniref:NADPH-dependent FMN reductase n=1 Tax=unclassified Thermosynechococcus TaxID=2622553 RepID=UPI0003D9583A|nr:MULTISPECIES: NAD(P)H-dependent oxidoreductase [unclassified Thermosynechococcus]AHB88682.1 NADPH-dependent FMN reductase SsuE family [Thermosynechococcus sp. NK55a]RMH63635.1 MAG: NADPH-dependent oxidoreductase [Cyanobacteria bacterium J003]HIK22617.1 NAD(P)H-dependent oxidoreductase [Thermosynechococcus sp. M3746_W2019_013]
MVKFIGWAGSLRDSSYSQRALDAAIAKAATRGVTVERLDLRQMRLPFCTGAESYPDYPDVAAFQAKVKEADGILLVTPEYHGSVSGVLKNSLDLLSFEHLSGKVVAMMSVLGGQTNSNALNDLRVILRWVHAWVIPEQVAIGQAWQAFTPEGQLSDPKLEERVDKLIASWIQTTRQLREARA